MEIQWINTINLKNGVDYNTNNYSENIDGIKISNEEYLRIRNCTNYLKFYKILPNSDETIIYSVNYEDVLKIKKLCKIGRIKGSISKSLIEEEELDHLVSELSNIMKNKKYFLRSDSCSPKDSVVGCCVYNGNDIINSLTGSQRIFTHLSHYDELTLILKPWKEDINPKSDKSNYGMYEFRTFICDKKLVAISSYYYYDAYDWSNIDLDGYFNKIIQFINTKIIELEKILETNSYTMDIYAKPFQEVEIIELNSFGMEMCAGSALFEWKKDKDILYGKSDKIVIRLSTNQ